MKKEKQAICAFGLLILCSTSGIAYAEQKTNCSGGNYNRSVCGGVDQIRNYYLNDLNQIQVSEKLATVFGYVKNSSLTANDKPVEPMENHRGWAFKQEREQVKGYISDYLNQTQLKISQSPTLSSCEAFGYIKDAMQTLEGKNESHEGHVNWCKGELEKKNWQNVVTFLNAHIEKIKKNL